jgi:cell division protein FtsQ
MSPDRITTTRAEAIRRRKEDEQKRREKLTFKKVSNPSAAPALKLVSASKPEPKARPITKTRLGGTTMAHSVVPMTTSRLSHRYDIAMSAPAGSARGFNMPKAPSISISMPRISFGPRALSFFMVVFCIIDMYFMLNNDPFIMHTADILGNQQITSDEIQRVLRIADLPAAFINPAQVQINVLAAFPNITNAQVDVNLPNNVVITIQERTPVAAWQQDGQTVWVDAFGYAFPPRGKIDNLPTVTALGAPPSPVVDPKQTIGAKPFLTSDLSQTIVTLGSYLPKGAGLVFDPHYGLGWTDPKGWKVYFGNSNENSALKLEVYKSLLDYLTKKNLKPTLISVEFPNAPFYQVEQ